MNRRGFLGALLKAGVGFAVLPSAVTYARKWQPTSSGLVVPSALIELPRGLRYHTITIYLSEPWRHLDAMPAAGCRINLVTGDY